MFSDNLYGSAGNSAIRRIREAVMESGDVREQTEFAGSVISDIRRAVHISAGLGACGNRGLQKGNRRYERRERCDI